LNQSETRIEELNRQLMETLGQVRNLEQQRTELLGGD
jgi:hypothetical protein